MKIGKNEIYILFGLLLAIIWGWFFWLSFCEHPWEKMTNYLTILTILVAFTGPVLSIMASQHISQTQLDSQEKYHNRELNDKYIKSALITLNYIIKEVKRLESSIQDYYRKQLKTNYNFDFSKWLIENLIEDKLIIGYYDKLKKEYLKQIPNKNNKISNSISNEEKNRLKAICEKTSKFYQESMYYWLPSSIQEDLNELNNVNRNISDFERLSDKIK